jgi:phosphoesterase RecJ-like protein
MKFLCNGEISYVAMSSDEFEALGVSTEYSDVLINVARSVSGVKVAVAVREIEGEPGRYKASLRSSCDFDVAAVCASFGGGGHIRAAGCALSADSAEAAAETVAAEVARRLK